MGRKQKLRRQKRMAKNNNNSNSDNGGNNNVPATGGEDAPATPSSPVSPSPSPSPRLTVALPVQYAGINATERRRMKALDGRFPPSEHSVTTDRLLNENGGVVDGKNWPELATVLQDGAGSDCVRCMHLFGRIVMNAYGGKQNYCVLPWLLEGAIRGHLGCVASLVNGGGSGGGGVYAHAEPCIPWALIRYWFERLEEAIGSGQQGDGSSKAEEVKQKVGRTCFACGKEDSETVTLEKCAGCKLYYYCGKKCQLAHWRSGGHMGECRQLKILKKYHKPHAVKIREAAIRRGGIGDNDSRVVVVIPQLEKLRRKLGLSRPIQEYRNLLDDLHDSGSESSSSKDAREFLVARNDGTVHVGSYQHTHHDPTPIGTLSLSSPPSPLRNTAIAPGVYER